MNNETRAKLESFLGLRFDGETRKTLWEKLAPDAECESMMGYAASLSQAIVTAGIADKKDEKALAGLLHALAAGNQSQVRQLLAKDGKAEKKKVDISNLF